MLFAGGSRLPGSASYAAAKAALHGLTRTLARELGPDGILVNVVMPGLTPTETNREHLSPEERDAYASLPPCTEGEGESHRDAFRP